MSTTDPFNQILPGWQGSPVPWSLIVSTPIDLTTLTAWSSVVTTYTGTAPASLVLYQGAAWQAVHPVTGEAPGAVAGHWVVVTSTPMDVSGWTRLFTVKKNYTDTDPEAVYIEDVVMPLLSIDGVLSGELPDSFTQTMAPGSYPFDVRVITLTSTEPQMMLAGKIVIAKTVGTRILPNITPHVIWPP